MKIHHNLGACVAGMVHSFARAVKKRKKQWRESVVHEVLFGDLLFTLDYLGTITLPFLIITLINILQIHQKTVNSCHVEWSGNYWPTLPQRHRFCSISFCCGTSLITWNVWEFWSRARVKYWIFLWRWLPLDSSHPKWEACLVLQQGSCPWM